MYKVACYDPLRCIAYCLYIFANGFLSLMFFMYTFEKCFLIKPLRFPREFYYLDKGDK